ncbi:hypothetical protein JCM8097_005479 [Rhodosporidiobolus ruineniae]
MSSDSEQPTSSRRVAQSSAKQARRAALDRLKQRTKSSSRPQPAFLGADDDDDDAGDGSNPFDGIAAVNAAFERQQKQRKRSTADRDQDASNSRQRDPLLGNAFDDLFDLDGASPSLGVSTGEGGAGDDISGAVAGDLDVEGTGAKKRKVLARMDEARLTGEKGFPKLQQDLKKVKLKGKGHELQDLRRVLTLYQLWTHEMFPRTNLRDTLQTVEKLCHKRSVQRALKQYRDLEKSGKHALDDDAADAAGGGADDLFGDLAAFGASSSAARPAASAGKDKGKEKEQQPQSQSARRMEEEEEDYDALFAAEEDILAELEREALAGAGAGAGASTSAAPVAAAAPAKEKEKKRLVFEEDEDMFGSNEAEDEVLAELEREAAAPSARPPPSTKPVKMVFEEDEDMFGAEEDILAELEREAAGAAVPSAAPPAPAPAAPAADKAPAPAPTPPAAGEEEEDDLYAAEEALLADLDQPSDAPSASVPAERAEEEMQERRDEAADDEAEAEAALREAEELLGF